VTSTESTPTPRVRRGDLAIIEVVRTVHTVHEGRSEHTDYLVAVVTSITRDGHVKAVREDPYGAGTGHPRTLASFGPCRVLTVPQAEVDVAAAQEAARQHKWHDGSLSKPFDSLDEVRAAVRPHRTV
jgi:hypothetical protein